MKKILNQKFLAKSFSKMVQISMILVGRIFFVFFSFFAKNGLKIFVFRKKLKNERFDNPQYYQIVGAIKVFAELVMQDAIIFFSKLQCCYWCSIFLLCQKNLTNGICCIRYLWKAFQNKSKKTRFGMYFCRGVGTGEATASQKFRGLLK